MCTSCPILGSRDASRIHVVISVIMLFLTWIRRLGHCVACGLRSIDVDSLCPWSLGGGMIERRIFGFLRKIPPSRTIAAIDFLIQAVKSFMGEVDSSHQYFGPLRHLLNE